MADGKESERKRRIEELLADKMAADDGCGDTGDQKGHWNMKRGSWSNLDPSHTLISN